MDLQHVLKGIQHEVLPITNLGFSLERSNQRSKNVSQTFTYQDQAPFPEHDSTWTGCQRVAASFAAPLDPDLLHKWSYGSGVEMMSYKS